jgi:hypothetical protein
MPESPYPGAHDTSGGGTVTFTFREMFGRLESKLDRIEQHVLGRVSDVEGRVMRLEAVAPPIDDGARRMNAIESYLPKFDDRLTVVERLLIEQKGGSLARDKLLAYGVGIAGIAGGVAAVIASQ